MILHDHLMGRRVLLWTLLVAASASCAMNSHMQPRTGAKIEELWEDPVDLAQRDLFAGPGGARFAPDPDDRFEVVSVKTTGTQPGYDVKDAKGRKWSTKMGEESRIEVTASRIAWAIGYHQPPTYYVAKWNRFEDGKAIATDPARFRPEGMPFDKVGEWVWWNNPFTGTRPLAGLFALMVILNNWDLYTGQNTIYNVTEEGEAPRTWYMVRDLGGSLGTSKWLAKASKGDTIGFVKERFIERVEGNRVRFHFTDHWREPRVHNIVTTADLRWVCGLLARLTSQQWADAFRAGGFTERETEVYVGRIKEKIAEGLALTWY
jgi:hypothetical protein